MRRRAKVSAERRAAEYIKKQKNLGGVKDWGVKLLLAYRGGREQPQEDPRVRLQASGRRGRREGIENLLVEDMGTENKISNRCKRYKNRCRKEETIAAKGIRSKKSLFQQLQGSIAKFGFVPVTRELVLTEKQRSDLTVYKCTPSCTGINKKKKKKIIKVHFRLISHPEGLAAILQFQFRTSDKHCISLFLLDNLSLAGFPIDYHLALQF